MAWYSILPSQLIFLESWAAKVFFVLGIITIIPWATLLIFDILLYICRMSLYEFPVIGGRARGMQRPRAPRLNERSKFGFGNGGGVDENENEDDRDEDNGDGDGERSREDSDRDKVKKESGMNGELKRRVPNQVEG